VLLVDTPTALILNLNDAKPLPPVVSMIRRVADRIAKPRILLCSYSPASLVNSFLDEAEIVSLKPARHYVDYVCRLCDALAADFYMPFASQAEFHRDDSCWANRYRATYRHLQQYWRSRARLLPPYTDIDLTDLTYRSTPPEQYRPVAAARLAELTAERAAAEQAVEISAADIAGAGAEAECLSLAPVFDLPARFHISRSAAATSNTMHCGAACIISMQRLACAATSWSACPN
jgi:hypothetical protein